MVVLVVSTGVDSSVSVRSISSVSVGSTGVNVPVDVGNTGVDVSVAGGLTSVAVLVVVGGTGVGVLANVD